MKTRAIFRFLSDRPFKNQTKRRGAALSELPAYLALAAAAPAFNRASVHDYTVALLLWWRNNHPSMPAWAEGARIAFALSGLS